jgi:hypothetical protein
MIKGGNELARGRIPELGVLSLLAVRISAIRFIAATRIIS